MSWRAVARLSSEDARRSRGLWVLTGLLVAVAAAATAVPAATVGGRLTAVQALPFLVAPLRVVVALAALLAGYSTIAGPRARGQLALVLGLPVSRTALVIGTFLGRSAVVLVGVAAGLLAAAASLPVVYGTLPAARLAGFALLLGLFAVAMTALAVGLSACLATPGRAAVAVVTAFVLFEFFWGLVPAGLYYVVEGALPGPTVPAWVVLVERLGPFGAFEAAARLALPAAGAGVRLSADSATATADPRSVADRLVGPTPAYLDPWVSVLVLVAWTVGPLLAGWLRFRTADL